MNQYFIEGFEKVAADPLNESEHVLQGKDWEIKRKADMHAMRNAGLGLLGGAALGAFLGRKVVPKVFARLSGEKGKPLKEMIKEIKNPSTAVGTYIGAMFGATGGALHGTYGEKATRIRNEED